MITQKSFPKTCKECPVEKRHLGSDRLVCTGLDQVVKSHWTPSTDCFNQIKKYQ